MNRWAAVIITSLLLIGKRGAGTSPEGHAFTFWHVYLMLEISCEYLSLSKFVNDSQKTNTLLYDAFIQCLRLPLEVFKKNL